jgi:hypothetical protein
MGPGACIAAPAAGATGCAMAGEANTNAIAQNTNNFQILTIVLSFLSRSIVPHGERLAVPNVGELPCR